MVSKHKKIERWSLLLLNMEIGGGGFANIVCEAPANQIYAYVREVANSVCDVCLGIRCRQLINLYWLYASQPGMPDSQKFTNFQSLIQTSWEYSMFVSKYQENSKNHLVIWLSIPTGQKK